MDVVGRIPTKAHDSDAGWDLYAARSYTVLGLIDILEEIGHKKEGLFKGRGINFEGINCDIVTGTHVAIDNDHVGMVLDRSGLGKHRIKIFGRVIDPGYTGEIVVMTTNFGRRWEIKEGDKVAQLVIFPVKSLDPNLVSELKKTERGDKGFNSTGR
jgi:deoxyuridine 5'-triphosphate nucleotidohydrolase